MPAYLPYPKAKDTPNRKMRKGLRNSNFVKNKVLARKLRKEARLARKAAEAAAEAGQE